MPLINRALGLRRLSSLLSPATTSLRKRQKAALQNLHSLLTRLDHDEADLSVLDDALTTLDSIFLITTVGEFNAGKSSLINALLGTEHCKVGVLPTTASVTLLGDPASTSTAAATNTAAEYKYDSVASAASWLHDVSIVDTPGTNTLDARHTALTREFVPRADVLLFVTSAERPFSESEQTFLRGIKQWGKKVAFVVNKADVLPTAKDLEDVVQHVGSNASREVGEKVPVFPVSARTALQLKDRASSAELGTDLSPFANGPAEVLAASQWSSLEGHILSYVKSDERALEKLQSQLSLSSAILGRCEADKSKAASLLRSDKATIAEAKRRLDVWEEEVKGEFDGQRARVRLVMHGLSSRGADFLQEELQLTQMMRLIMGRDAFVKRFQEKVLSDASQRLQDTSTSIAGWMEQKGASQARSTSEFLQTRLAPTIKSAAAADNEPVGGGFYHKERVQLLLQLQGDSNKAIEGFDSKAAAERMASASQGTLAQFALIEAAAAGVTGLVAVKAVALADLTGLLPAALLAFTGLGILPVQRYRLQRDYSRNVDELASALDRAVASHLEGELGSAKGRAGSLITPFATLVGSAHAKQEEELAALKRAREELDGLANEAKELRKGS